MKVLRSRAAHNKVRGRGNGNETETMFSAAAAGARQSQTLANASRALDKYKRTESGHLPTPRVPKR